MEYKNFIRDYLTNNKGKINPDFINNYLGTGATIEYFIYRELQKRFSEEQIEEILGTDTYDRVNKIMNAYMNGIEGQNVSHCDFSALSQEEFEMLRFDEDTIFNQETINQFHPEEILTRRNTQIPNKTDNGNILHIAIIDTPIVKADDVPNLIVHNLEKSSEEPTDSHHGRSAYSIFSSIASNCVVHFYGVGSEDKDRAEAVQAIIDYNNKCSDESQKIRLISCSHNLGEKEGNLIKEGKLNVISSNNIHSGDFFEYFRTNDTDVIPLLTDEEKESIKSKYSHPDVSPIAERFIKMIDKYIKKAVLVNANLTIDQYFKKIKRHECDISVSWGVPVVAAYYAMALKENPNMSYEEFHNICKKSLKENTNIFDEELFMENIKEIKQEKTEAEIISFFHDQKSDDFFEDVQTGRYSIPEQQIGKATINTPTKIKDEAREQIVREEQQIEQEELKK